MQLFVRYPLLAAHDYSTPVPLRWKDRCASLHLGRSVGVTSRDSTMSNSVCKLHDRLTDAAVWSLPRDEHSFYLLLSHESYAAVSETGWRKDPLSVYELLDEMQRIYTNHFHYLGQGLLVLWVGPLFGLGLAWLSRLKRRQELVLVTTVAVAGLDIWCFSEVGYLFQ